MEKRLTKLLIWGECVCISKRNVLVQQPAASLGKCERRRRIFFSQLVELVRTAPVKPVVTVAAGSRINLPRIIRPSDGAAAATARRLIVFDVMIVPRCRVGKVQRFAHLLSALADDPL